LQTARRIDLPDLAVAASAQPLGGDIARKEFLLNGGVDEHE
jgi:hypothetical protein